MKQVTGSNPEAPSKEMSIRLRPDGHSFPATLPAGFETADRIRCSVLTYKTVLVPAEVFERESAANYLALAGLGCMESECAVYSEPQRQQIAVMAVDRAQHRLLTEGAGDRIVYTSPLLHRPDFPKQGVWLMHTDGLLYLKVYDDGLRLAEAVRAQGTTDVLYYLGRLGRSFPLGNFPIVLSGSDTLARQLRKYFPDVQCE